MQKNISSANRRQVNVIIADDNHDFLLSAISFLESDTTLNLKIIETAKNGYEAIEFSRLLKPDIILMDIYMPVINSVKATRSIKELPNPPKIINISLYDSTALRNIFISSGADGFINKMEFGDKIIGLISELCDLDDIS